MEKEFIFGMDPVDFNHSRSHPTPRFVSLFHVSDGVNNVPFVCSWSHALLFRRFCMCLGLGVYELPMKINCRLIRFNLDRYYSQFKKTFNFDNKYDNVRWSDLDESGIIKFRSKNL